MPRLRFPALDAQASRHFTYRHLVQSGETFARLAVGLEEDERDRLNLPAEAKSWVALSVLATSILDPLVERFGRVELTYCFAGSALTRHVPGRIAPALDQHAAMELTRTGGRVCARGGAAVDLRVTGIDARSVARFIVAELPFDRLYFYGEDRPLHISAGPEQSRSVFELLQVGPGRRLPRRWTP